MTLGLLLIVAGAAAASESAPDAVAVLASPAAPVAGGPLRAMAVAERPLDVALTVLDPRGVLLARTRERHGGPPYWWEVEVTTRHPGTYRACLGGTMACEEVRVDAAAGRRPVGDGAWPIARQWNRASEDLYAAWIEKLFDDPLAAEPSWRSLHEVTRQPERNFLFDHLGLGEDGERGLRLEPDCADLPYVLRAYFAWKLGLPFGWSECSRGDGGHPPSCPRWSAAPTLPAGGDELAAAQRFFLALEDAVQSGNGRVPATSDGGDFYPTRLSVDGLRPGTVYADPYGHTLLLVQRVDQTPSSPGLLLAVDAQPDGTVARKRYWRGNFLFALDPTLGSPGFKRFRPVVGERGALRPLANREIAAAPDYGDYGLEQYDAGVEGFYDRVDAVLSPRPVDPERVFRATIDALEEQMRARLRSVANGEAYVAAHPGVIAMPEGASIFETSGAWEDFATPSRDLRLLIALDVVRAFPAKVEAQPQRFAMPAGRRAAEVRADLDDLLRAESAARQLTYTRSDGSPWTLTLADLLGRAEALEMAYNPNDCVEVRWGAAPGSAEMATCRRHAPAEQAARMARYRVWFHERRRPPR
ncbi:hypothetical protein KF840_18610 [bacterium]|nr:hypothetical protein [bacterium]